MNPAWEIIICNCLLAANIIFVALVISRHKKTERIKRYRDLLETITEVRTRAIRYLNFINAVRDFWRSIQYPRHSLRTSLLDDVYREKYEFEIVVNIAIERLNPDFDSRLLLELKQTLDTWLDLSLGQHSVYLFSYSLDGISWMTFDDYYIAIEGCKYGSLKDKVDKFSKECQVFLESLEDLLWSGGVSKIVEDLRMRMNR